MNNKEIVLIITEIILIIGLVIYITSDPIVTNTTNLLSLIVVEIIYFIYDELRSHLKIKK